MKKDFIQSYWNNQANTHKDSHKASWGDNYMIELEIDQISRYLEDGDSVLDVGCANGYSAFKQLEKRNSLNITGIDFAEEMISRAKERLQKNKNVSSLNFEIGDIRALNFEDDSFDKVYTTRVIINLPNWEEQMTGISELLRVTKPMGKVIICEAFWEPLVLLNSMRALKNLKPLEEHDFNRYLKISRLEKFLMDHKLEFERIDFSSIYYLGSRFLRELVTDADKFEGFSNPINDIFYQIEKEYSGGGFGIQQSYVIQKPGV